MLGEVQLADTADFLLPWFLYGRRARRFGQGGNLQHRSQGKRRHAGFQKCASIEQGKAPGYWLFTIEEGLNCARQWWPLLTSSNCKRWDVRLATGKMTDGHANSQVAQPP
jgi:hypothetical protein